MILKYVFIEELKKIYFFHLICKTKWNKNKNRKIVVKINVWTSKKFWKGREEKNRIIKYENISFVEWMSDQGPNKL